MKTLLTAVDFSKTTDAVIREAARLAKALDARLLIVHVASDETQAMVYEASQFSGYAPEFSSMPGDVQMARDINAEEMKREHRELQSISSKLRTDGMNAQALLLKGPAADLLIEKAQDPEIEMIVLGSHGHGLLHKALLGSVSESVIRRAPCSVLIVPAHAN